VTRCYLRAMDQSPESANALPPPEIFRVNTVQVACDGSGQIDPALGHPRVFLRIEPDIGWVECGYCDRRFILEGGPADEQAA
jgi:NADH dehydrogenase (ubiquinone) Fe-S protein 6